jgi:hypothetical protein
MPLYREWKQSGGKRLHVYVYKEKVLVCFTFLGHAGLVIIVVDS